MGLFDFLRRKKSKPAEVKPEGTKDSVKQNESANKQDAGEQPREKKGSIHSHAKVKSPVQRPAQRQHTTNKTARTSQRNYTVKAGDSLSRIAKQFYGNANDWQKIYEANKNRIKDPNIIHPGQSLIIP